MTSPEPRFATVLTEFEEGTLTLTLNRPDKLNALNDTMYEELLSALDAADADDAVKAVIVTGAGRAFCAGADLSGRGEAFTASRGDACKPARDRGGVIALKIFNSAKPVIGAINGPAIGLGASITLPMDIRLCSTSAKFGFVYVRRGIAVEGAASWFLPRAVGHGLAMEWALTGRHIEADEAVRGGLVRGAYRSSALLPAARALAIRIVAEHLPAIHHCGLLVQDTQPAGQVTTPPDRCFRNRGRPLSPSARGGEPAMTSQADEHERTLAFAEIALGQIRALRQPATPRERRKTCRKRSSPILPPAGTFIWPRRSLRKEI